MLTRYVMVAPSSREPGKALEFGVFNGPFDQEILARRLSLSLRDACHADAAAHSWLSEPPPSIRATEFWFTQEGDREFREKSLRMIVARTPPGWAIYRKTVALDEEEGFETLVVWRDHHQVAV